MLTSLYSQMKLTGTGYEISSLLQWPVIYSNTTLPPMKVIADNLRTPYI